MPNDAKKKRTWTGLVCPVCRFVFRVPKDHDGTGVICPACQYLLKVPGTEDRGPVTSRSPEETLNALVPKPRNQKESKPIVSRPLTESDAVSQSNTSHTSTSNQHHRGRRKKKSNSAEQGWDSKASVGKSDAKSEGESPMLWVVGGSLLGITIVGIGAWLVIDSLDDKGSADDGIAARSAVDSIEPLILKEDEMTDEEKKRKQEIADSVKIGMNVLADAEVVVRKFLNAKTSSELETLVRTPEVTIPRMRAWYTTNEWTPPGAKDIGYGGRVTIKGVMASMAVRLNDYSVTQIALENTSSGYLIDWESWVAWSSMDWDTLFEKRPTDPVEVRVQCTLDSYYNRVFNDDAKWVAVRLEHPTADRIIYGYIDKESLSLMRLLTDLRRGKVTAATIKIRYPIDSVAKNQVFITEYIQNGWVRPSAAEAEVKVTDEVTDEKKDTLNTP